MFAPKNILVPTDFSRCSDNAVSHALDLAREYHARIYLLHVIGLLQQCSVDYCLDGATLAEVERQSTEAAATMMKEQISKMAGAGEADIQTDVRQGVPYEEILREQMEKKIDVIVMGSRGKTGLLSHFGSVADNIARRAQCPVLIVKGDAR